MPYILAHDLGTTGDKATLLDVNKGQVLASTFEPYPTAYPRPGWAEQDPADWKRALVQGTRRLLDQSALPAHEVAAVSFSGHMQGALLVDRAGIPLRPAILWADQRATVQADAIAQACGRDAIYRRTGCQISPTYTAPKVLWIKDNQPALYNRAARMLQVKDYAAFLLSGVLTTDYSDASSTQLFDLQTHQWASDLIAALGLRPDLFPPAVPSTTVIGSVTAQAARQTGLLSGTPVVIGGGDGACATVGAGAVQEGDAYTYIGSSAWTAVTTRRPLLDPQQRTFTFAHLDPELYFSVGTAQAAGGSYGWLDRLLRQESQDTLYEELDAAAAEVSAGAQGLLFLPHLLGERSPYWNPLARGAFIGLSMAHGRAELARAVLEGVTYHMRLILDTLQEQGVRIAEMRLIGGGAQSAVWRQIFADILRIPVLLPTLPTEATSLGAAIAGGVGVELLTDLRAARDLAEAHKTEQPNPAHGPRYDRLYTLYQQSYAALKSIFDQLAELP